VLFEDMGERRRAGYYGRNLVTRIGKLELRVPRDRGGPLHHHAEVATKDSAGRRQLE
jgi:transposase-like protein